MKSVLSQDSRGTFQRDLGWKLVGGDYRQHRFYLGRERAQALIRSLQLEQIWEALVKRWDRDRIGERPLWDAETLAIGQAVARGENHVVVNHRAGVEGLPIPDATVAAWLGQLRKDFPGVRIDLEDGEVQERGQERLERAADQHAESERWIRQTGGSQTLHQALDAFNEWIKQTCLTPGLDKRVSPYGVSKQVQVKQIKEHAQDVPLAQFDLNAIERLLNYWRNRPIGKRSKKPMSPAHVRDIIKRIREFLRWLHRNSAFEWRKPADLETTPLRIPLTHDEVAAKLSPMQVKTYTADQLGILYEYASPVERLLMLLALNCGFGAAEVGSLQLGEVFLDQVHPNYGLPGSWVKRLRFKSHVYGEWKLWDATVAGIRWYLARRPQSDETVLLLTEKGKALTAPTAGNNRNQRIQNVWKRLRDRVVKDHPRFPALSFNKLRKTAGDLVKRFSDGEIAGVFLCHGQTVRTDDLADVYTNRHFDKVFRAQEAVGVHLAGMFAKAADPFPADYRKQHPSLSLGTIKRIRAMRGQGFTIHKIAETVNLPDETVRYYCRKPQKQAEG